jgi:hypothetical protein
VVLAHTGQLIFSKFLYMFEVLQRVASLALDTEYLLGANELLSHVRHPQSLHPLLSHSRPGSTIFPIQQLTVIAYHAA